MAEIKEFLRIIKNSEFCVVEQLNKMPAQISILGLLIASEAHRNALLKILNEAHVASTLKIYKIWWDRPQRLSLLLRTNFLQKE